MGQKTVDAVEEQPYRTVFDGLGVVGASDVDTHRDGTQLRAELFHLLFDGRQRAEKTGGHVGRVGLVGIAGGPIDLPALQLRFQFLRGAGHRCAGLIQADVKPPLLDQTGQMQVATLGQLQT